MRSLGFLNVAVGMLVIVAGCQSTRSGSYSSSYNQYPNGIATTTTPPMSVAKKPAAMAVPAVPPAAEIVEPVISPAAAAVVADLPPSPL